MRAKPDLQLRWSKRENDVLGEWNSPACKQDLNLLFYALNTDRPKYNSIETMPSLLKELEQRGL